MISVTAASLFIHKALTASSIFLAIEAGGARVSVTFSV